MLTHSENNGTEESGLVAPTLGNSTSIDIAVEYVWRMPHIVVVL